ncbi:hypothetical protein [Nocardioides limicola]|uniref:hypothetical protein n=1 Tax=Nocardioides limicola TaxID=2803368 RepID=UPI00193BA994|nr:hypothetical protein [Nocardioides sp. DJM-14]
MPAAHKPGVIPLRPLKLGDIYDAAFRTIRFNPQATVGSALLVGVVAMGIPVLLTSILTLAMGWTLDASGAEPTGSEWLGVMGPYGSMFLGTVLMSVGLILVTGMIAHVVAAAAVGTRLSLGQAWDATEGKRLRLVGLALLLGGATFAALGVYALMWVGIVQLTPWQGWVLFGLISVPALICAMIWFWIRVYYLPVAALMLEPIGVFEAIGRGFALTRAAFWRTFGIALLTFIIAQIASSMISLPFSMFGMVGPFLVPEYAILITVAFSSVGTIAATAFVAPFSTSVAVLQYLDLRIRKEGYDVELAGRAGLAATPPTAAPQTSGRSPGWG